MTDLPHLFFQDLFFLPGLFCLFPFLPKPSQDPVRLSLTVFQILHDLSSFLYLFLRYPFPF